MKLDMDEQCEHVHKDAPYGAICEDCGRERIKHHSFIYCNNINDKTFKQMKGGKENGKNN